MFEEGKSIYNQSFKTLTFYQGLMIFAASHVHVFGEDRPSQNNRPALVDNSGSSATLGVPRLAYGKHRRI